MSELKDDKKQFNVYLPPDLIRAVKHAAVDEGLSLSVFVERVLRDYMEQMQKKQDEEEENRP